jgi:uncharacterized glyoxalase superfamily metalloenzyme YdcJ
LGKRSIFRHNGGISREQTEEVNAENENQSLREEQVSVSVTEQWAKEYPLAAAGMNNLSNGKEEQQRKSNTLKKKWSSKAREK